MKICSECDKSFKGKRKQVHCSKECRGAFVRRNSRELIKCDNCLIEFSKLKSQVKRSKKHYCSENCKYIHQSVVFRGDNNPNWRGLTYKTNCSNCEVEFECRDYYNSGRLYCSQKCKGVHQKVTLTGRNNPNYNPDKEDKVRNRERSYAGYKEWRMKVFNRDGFSCIKCGKNSTRDNKLVAHHILNHYSHPELRLDVDNGATLCTNHHWEFHRIYGTLHNNRKQLDEFITPIEDEIC